MRWLFAAVMLAACSVAWGQTIEGPDRVGPDELGRLSIELGEGESAAWDAVGIQDGRFIVADGESVDGGRRYLFTGAPGQYRVTVYYISGGQPQIAHKVVTIGGDAPPDPPGPTPPDPDDDDTDPTPTPDKAPFPANGLHVLIVYESADQNELSRDQRAILFGEGIRRLLETETDDQYRILDADADMSSAETPWPAAMDVLRDSLPWVVISDGKTGFSGPLPETPEAFSELVERFAK